MCISEEQLKAELRKLYESLFVAIDIATVNNRKDVYNVQDSIFKVIDILEKNNERR